jgi:hypothetical protein
LHERVVTAAGTGVVSRLTGQKYSITDVGRDRYGFSMRSMVTDGTIPRTIALRLPTERKISAGKRVPTKPDGIFLTGQIWLDNEIHLIQL